MNKVRLLWISLLKRLALDSDYIKLLWLDIGYIDWLRIDLCLNSRLGNRLDNNTHHCFKRLSYGRIKSGIRERRFCGGGGIGGVDGIGRIFKPSM